MGGKNNKKTLAKYHLAHYKPTPRKPKNVYWEKSCRMWRVKFGIDNRDFHVGLYKYKKDAIEAAARFRVLLNVQPRGRKRKNNDLQS